MRRRRAFRLGDAFLGILSGAGDECRMAFLDARSCRVLGEMYTCRDADGGTRSPCTCPTNVTVGKPVFVSVHVCDRSVSICSLPSPLYHPSIPHLSLSLSRPMPRRETFLGEHPVLYELSCLRSAPSFIGKRANRLPARQENFRPAKIISAARRNRRSHSPEECEDCRNLFSCRQQLIVIVAVGPRKRLLNASGFGVLRERKRERNQAVRSAETSFRRASKFIAAIARSPRINPADERVFIISCRMINVNCQSAFRCEKYLRLFSPGATISDHRHTDLQLFLTCSPRPLPRPGFPASVARHAVIALIRAARLFALSLNYYERESPTIADCKRFTFDSSDDPRKIF